MYLFPMKLLENGGGATCRKGIVLRTCLQYCLTIRVQTFDSSENLQKSLRTSERSSEAVPRLCNAPLPPWEAPGASLSTRMREKNLPNLSSDTLRGDCRNALQARSPTPAQAGQMSGWPMPLLVRLVDKEGTVHFRSAKRLQCNLCRTSASKASSP